MRSSFKAEPAAGPEAASVLGCAAADATVDHPLVDLGEAARGCEPGQRLLGCVEHAGVVAAGAELDEREQPPERASPLAVRMDAVVAPESVDELVTHAATRRGPGCVDARHLHAVDELDPRPGVLADQQVAVEVDVVEERGDVRARGDAEAGLDHAAEHQPEPERARGVRHPHAPRGRRPTWPA